MLASQFNLFIYCAPASSPVLICQDDQVTNANTCFVNILCKELKLFPAHGNAILSRNATCLRVDIVMILLGHLYEQSFIKYSLI